MLPQRLIGTTCINGTQNSGHPAVGLLHPQREPNFIGIGAMTDQCGVRRKQQRGPQRQEDLCTDEERQSRREWYENESRE